MTKHEHIFVSISKTKEKCVLCDQFRKKVHEYKDCPDPYKCDIHIGIGGTS